MKLEKVIAISGKPGLFEIISQSKSGIIVESLSDHQPVFVCGGPALDGNANYLILPPYSQALSYAICHHLLATSDTLSDSLASLGDASRVRGGSRLLLGRLISSHTHQQIIPPLVLVWRGE